MEDDVHVHKLCTSVIKNGIAALSGYNIRTDYKFPGEADPLPKADAMLVIPSAFNTINKWAQGIKNIASSRSSYGRHHGTGVETRRSCGGAPIVPLTKRCFHMGSLMQRIVPHLIFGSMVTPTECYFGGGTQ